MKILETVELSKTYKKGFSGKPIQALKPISISVEKGQVLGLVGPNGSGKSTFFKSIMGFIKPTTGHVRLFGSDNNRYGYIGTSNCDKKRTFIEMPLSVKGQLGYLHEKTNFYSELTPIELLSFYGSFFKMGRRELKKQVNDLLKLVDLEEYKNEQVSRFSKGMVQRVGIAISLMGDTKLLIFDEPLSGLDLLGVIKIKEIIKRLVDEGKSLILSSHTLSHIQEVCSNVLILNKGHCLRNAPLNEVLQNKEQLQVAVQLKEQNDVDRILDLLKANGFQVDHYDFFERDLESLFLSIVEETK